MFKGSWRLQVPLKKKREFGVGRSEAHVDGGFELRWSWVPPVTSPRRSTPVLGSLLVKFLPFA